MNDERSSVTESMQDFNDEPMDFEQIKLTLEIMQLDPADRAVIRVAGKSIIINY